MTTDEVRLLINFFMQKETGGYVSPDRMQLAVNRAQYEVFANYIGFPQGYGADGQAPPVAYDRTRRIAETLLPFKVDYTITLNNGIGSFPDNYVYLDAFRIRYYQNPDDCQDPVSKEPEGVLRYVSVDVVTEKEWADRVNSTIDYPTFEYPIVRFESKTTIEASPRTIRRMTMIYLRKPAPFYWGRTLSTSGIYTYDPNDPLNQELEWYEIDQNKIIMGALSFLGISIREQDIIQYAEMKSKTGV